MTGLKRLIFATGKPGIGKTSVLLRTVDALKSKNYRTGGMISREVREGGLRVGFEILDVCTGQRGWLAHVNQSTGPKISKYRVNLMDLDAIGAASIRNAMESDDIIVVDEIGPMELSSPAFRAAVLAAVESRKPLLGTIHYGLSDQLINRVRAREDAEILEVTHDNRVNLHKTIVEKVISFVRSSQT